MPAFDRTIDHPSPSSRLPAPSLPHLKHLIYRVVYSRTPCGPIHLLVVNSSDTALSLEDSLFTSAAFGLIVNGRLTCARTIWLSIEGTAYFHPSLSALANGCVFLQCFWQMVT